MRPLLAFLLVQLALVGLAGWLAACGSPWLALGLAGVVACRKAPLW